MLRAVVSSAAPLRTLVARQLVRNLGVTAACTSKATDPIQRLFIDKVHDYATKSKAAGGKLVDASPVTEKTLADELEKLARQYGAKGHDFTKFPTFSFTDPDLEPVGITFDAKAVVEAESHAETAKATAEEEDKPYYEP